MKKDCHMHPNILKKPENTDLFIEQAIKLGFEEIYFTDHMPFSITGDEHDRIPFGKVREYCEKVKEKAEEFKDKIIIKTGIEIDYHPSCLKEIEDVLSCGDFDYVIGSTHLNIKGFNIDMKNTTYTEFASLVLENQLSAAKSGYFNTISHLDIYRWVFSEKKEYPLINDGYNSNSLQDKFEEIFKTLEEKKINLELNAAPLYKKFDDLGFYPEFNVLALSKKYSLNYVYGSDAHFPCHVGYGYDAICSCFCV